MGTSASNRGPGPNAPMVPNWADPLPPPSLPDPDEELLPEPDDEESDQQDGSGEESDDIQPKALPEKFQTAAVAATLRLTGFRRKLGNAVARGPSDRSQGDLRGALQTYAKATGGGKIAAQRAGSATAAGGRIYSLFATGSAVGPNGQVLELASLAGQETRVVIDRIVDVLVARNGDRDRISSALKDALPQALNGVQTFNAAAVDRDFLINLMVIYTQECVFQQIIADSDRAFQRNEDQTQVGQMEGQLHALVVAVVGDQMAPLFEENSTLSEAQAREAQSKAIERTWNVWERRRR